MKTVDEIKAEYVVKVAKIRAMGITDQEMLKDVLSDAHRIMVAETEAVSKAAKSAAREGIQITPTLRLSFPPLEDCIKTKGKGAKAYDFNAVQGGTVKLSHKEGEGEQSSYTAYLPLSMYQAIMANEVQISQNIHDKAESGHLFKVPGVRSVAATKALNGNHKGVA